MTKKPVKIVTIGGGSSYTPELVEGFIKRYDELPVKELWLVDIEEGKEKLEIVGNLAKRMVEKSGLPMKVFLTLDREEALPNADFVTTQFRVGLLDARIKDERIPLSHGLIGQETNGIGGMFKGLRTIPVILDIVKDIKKYCPDAWLINFTNPSGMVTEAVLKYTDHTKIVGLCNVPIGMQMSLALMLDVPPEKLRLQIAGLNHHFFATDVFIEGKSVMPEVLEKYIAFSKEYSIKERMKMMKVSRENIGKEGHKAEESLSKTPMLMPFSEAFLRGIQAVPCGYMMYYYHTKEMLEMEVEEYKQGNVRAEVVKRTEAELFELYKDENLNIKPPQLEKRGGAHYSDAACNLIASIYTDKGDIQYVNCKNNGAVSGIDNNSGVEIAAVITADGPKPMAIGTLPPTIRGTIQNIKAFESLVCEAAVTGNKNIAITALNNNPLVPSDTMASEIFEEMLEAHKRYLPNFFK